MLSNILCKLSPITGKLALISYCQQLSTRILPVITQKTIVYVYLEKQFYKLKGQN